MSDSTSKTSAANNAKWSFLGTASRQALNFFVATTLARILGPNAFGTVAIAMVWIGFADLFINQGFGMTIIQRKTVTDRDINTIFWTAQFIALLVTSITWLASDPLAYWLRSPEIAAILKALSITFFLSSLAGVQAAILTRNLHFKSLALRVTATSLVGGCVGIVCALNNLGLWSLVAQQLASGTTGALVLWKASSWRPKLEFSWSSLKTSWSFSTKILLANILAYASSRTDQLLIGRLLGTADLGLYNNAKRFPELINDLLRAPVTSVAVPRFAKMQADTERLTAATFKAHRMILLFMVPAFIAVAFLAKEIVRFLFGEKWLGSAPLLEVFASQQAVAAFAAIAYSVLMAVGRPGQCLLLQALQTLGAILAAVIGTHFGMMGVAALLFATTVIITFISCHLMGSALGVKLRLFFIEGSAPVFATLIMILPSVALRYFLDPAISVYVALPLHVFVMAITYFLALLAISKPDVVGIFDMIKSAIGLRPRTQ